MELDISKIERCKKFEELHQYIVNDYLKKTNNHIVKFELEKVINRFFFRIPKMYILNLEKDFKKLKVKYVSRKEMDNLFIEKDTENKNSDLKDENNITLKEVKKPVFNFSPSQDLFANKKEKESIVKSTKQLDSVIKEVKLEETNISEKAEVKKDGVVTKKTTSKTTQPKKPKAKTIDYKSINDDELENIYDKFIKNLFNVTDDYKVFDNESGDEFFDGVNENIISTKFPNLVPNFISKEVAISASNNMPEIEEEKFELDQIIDDNIENINIVKNISSEDDLWSKMSKAELKKYFFQSSYLGPQQWLAIKKFFVNYIIDSPLNEVNFLNLLKQGIENADKKLYRIVYENFLMNRMKYKFILDYNLFYDAIIKNKSQNKFYDNLPKVIQSVMLNVLGVFIENNFYIKKENIRWESTNLKEIVNFYWEINQKMHIFEFKDYVYSPNPNWKLEYVTELRNFFNSFEITSKTLFNKIIISNLDSFEIKTLLLRNVDKINFLNRTFTDNHLWDDVRNSCHLSLNELNYIKGNALNNLQIIYEEKFK